MPARVLKAPVPRTAPQQRMRQLVEASDHQLVIDKAGKVSCRRCLNQCQASLLKQWLEQCDACEPVGFTMAGEDRLLHKHRVLQDSCDSCLGSPPLFQCLLVHSLRLLLRFKRQNCQQEPPVRLQGSAD